MAFKLCAMDWQTVKSLAMGFLPTVLLWILGLAMPIIIAIWGRVANSWSWPHTFLAFLAAVALGLFIYNNLPIDWPIKSKKVEQNLRKWADEAGFSIKSDPQDYARFQFIITDDKGYTVTVFNNKKDSPLEIRIATKLVFTEKQQKEFSQKGEEWQKQFLDSINIELLKFGVGYEFKRGPLNEINISNKIFYDKNMHKMNFLDKTMFVRRALYLIIAIFQKEFSIS